MSQQSKNTLQTAINSQIADNTAGDISAADIRDNLINMTDSLVFNTGSQSITGSFAQGFDIQAIGIYSHAEGDSTKTGITTAYSASVTDGIVTLDSSYGDVSTGFGENGRLLLYDAPFDENYYATTFIINQSYYNNPNTILELVDTSVTTTTAYVGDITYGISNWTGNQTIPGDYSHAEGQFTLAIGYISHAEGYNTQAIGEYSHAEGTGTQAIGNYSHAEGEGTQAIGQSSHAEGDNTQAIGYASHAEGGGTQAIGGRSHAEGDNTKAIGNRSHAEGEDTQAIGSRSHAEGYGAKTGVTTAYSASIIDGIVTLDSSYGDVSGEFGENGGLLLYDSEFDSNYGLVTFIISQSSFDNTNTVVELVNTSVTTTTAYVGDLSYGIDNWTGNQIIPGDYSHAEGIDTFAIGNYSHTEGYSTQTLGESSHAEGQFTLAIGNYSHAEGDSTQAIGESSHAEGAGTIALGYSQHVQGLYNITSSAGGAFIIGNGSVDTRSNLVFASGSQFQVTGSINVTGGVTGSLFGTASFAVGTTLPFNAFQYNIFASSNIEIPTSGYCTIYASEGDIFQISIHKTTANSLSINQYLTTRLNNTAVLVNIPTLSPQNFILTLTGLTDLGAYVTFNMENGIPIGNQDIVYGGGGLGTITFIP